MRVLIDSHALIWYVDQDKLLSLTSHAAMSDPSNELLLSAGSIWEIGIKIGFVSSHAAIQSLDESGDF